tara:strand:+ start:1707 stop:2435 length:729 start_codon:yes stop_codon:yes gene_type:complete
MSWDSLIKVQGAQPKTITDTATMDLDIKPTPKRKPKKTCVELFNNIVDYILQEVNRIEAGSGELWNTGKGEGPHTMDGDWFNIWTYYFMREELYRKQDYYEHALIESEHDCGYAENEEDACYHLKSITKMNISPRRELRMTAQDALPQLEYFIHLNTFHADDTAWEPQTIHSDGKVTGGPRSGAIQLSVGVMDINEHSYIKNMTEEEQRIYIPLITRVIKEHDNMFNRVIQMAKDAVAELGL